MLALNIRMHTAELVWCIESGSPQVVVVSEKYADLAVDFQQAMSDPLAAICIGRQVGALEEYETVLASAQNTTWDEPRGEDIHVIMYTSGTTGRPKGAMISQAASAIRGQRLAQWFELGPEDGFLGWTPMFHCAGDESLYATMLTGGTYATVPLAEPEALFRAIEDHKVTWGLLLPGVITAFLEHPRRSEYDLSSMRFAIGYANMMPAVVERLTTELNMGFSDAFGQTETSYLIAHRMVEPGEKVNGAKNPTPLIEIKLVDENLDEVPVGEPGECVVRGPSLMTGYLENDAATAEVFAGGWLHTGDVLVQQEDGTLKFVDRVKFLIKSGGENVYPTEVESVLASHPDVLEACVFGVPDDKWGEAVKAAVVLRLGKTVDRQEIDQWCRERLAGYKRPKFVEFLQSNDIPRSTTGKVLRGELAAQPVSSEQEMP